MKYSINIQHLVPVNEKGAENDAVAVKTCISDSAAQKIYEVLQEKLLDISNWKVNAGKNPADFLLLDEKGMHGPLLAKEGNMVRIEMPAPKNRIGNGYDWVTVLKISSYRDTQTAYLMIQLKPHSCVENADGSIAHFYTAKSTNTFILALSDTTIQLSIHGRNEIPNTENLRLIDKLRNLLVAGGGIFGGGKLQWQQFADEFLK